MSEQRPPVAAAPLALVQGRRGELYAAAAVVVLWLVGAARGDLVTLALTSVGLAAWLVWRLRSLSRDLQAESAQYEQTRRRARAQEAQDRALLGALSDRLFVLDIDGNVLPPLAAPGEDLPPAVALSTLFSQSSAELLMQEMRSALASGSVRHSEFSEPAASGALDYEARLLPYQERKALVLVRETTARRRLATELRAARETALEAARIKTKFLANMSHEIRTPMNGVIGMTNLLLETPLSAEQNEYAQIIQKSGQSLLTIIDDILDFAKIEAGKLELEQVHFDLHSCVDECVEAASAQARAKGLELGAVFDVDVPSGARGDPLRLRQILTNLVNNAVRFTERGSVVVRVSRDPAHPDGLRFTVQDTGIGIARERFPRLFQPVLLGDATALGMQAGTGLGLAIAHELVQLMGGDIDCQSVVGKGTVFEVRVRLPKFEPVRVIPTWSGAAGERAWVACVHDVAKPGWVVVEQLAASGLAVVEWTPEAASSALAASQRERPCLALLIDATRDPLRAARVVAELADQAESMHAPLVVIAAQPEELTEPTRRHAARVLSWPVRQSELATCLSVIQQRPREQRPADPDPARLDKLAARVLVADDDPINQRVLRRLLTQLGCSCETAADGRSAVEQAVDGSFDAVLMDCQMPELDGFSAAREIRAREASRAHKTRIIALTGSTSDEDRRLSREAGMDSFLTKPVSKEQLGAELLRLLSWGAEHDAAVSDVHEQLPRTIEALGALLEARDLAALARTAGQLVSLAQNAAEVDLATWSGVLAEAASAGDVAGSERALELLRAEQASILRRPRDT